MSQPGTEEILEVCGKVGEILLNAGAETSRIETTVEYIGHAAGASVACYATITAVFVSLENESRTRLIKSTLGGFNLQKVDELNQLSREFVAHRITFEALKQEVARIDHQVINFPWWARILGAGWVSVAPMLLFKATNGDLALAFFVGIFGYLAAEYVGRRTTTPYFKEATGAFVVAILAELLVS
ncbi:threonine/serine exporter ThrE family protein, partial [Lacticaseibacillus paracasei]